MNISYKKSILQKLIPIINEAGEIVMHYFNNKKFDLSFKKDKSPVTIADKEADKIITNNLKKVFSDIEVISEENIYNHSSKPGNLFFLVDAIDGTKEFIKEESAGNFTINIGLIENGCPILGVILAPYFKKLYYGIEEVGAFCNSKRIFTREVLNDEPLILSGNSNFDKETTILYKKKGLKKKKLISSSLKFCYIASGDADFYSRFGTTMEWDTAAGHAILLSAGGDILSIEGKKIKYGKSFFKNESFIAFGNKKNYENYFRDE